ncbi:MAG TPA: tRNA (N6-isopentenyl adenosine(37)-C2)-methylthiotransferase MiaB [Candidatus Hydrogenedentes bacterium]|nr:tRNA (N6-isopentenyl adenosine(37)-C2)-methylthiotransferase MiaB [Candidatus Hydrogenedentota bacterium]HOL75511.1 tRNA (N6-isopentenyl adenosine(37)-C2)-methylthiotransferase MiaB [Candidatus Hydrogenedentota bacterium]HPO86047.1 tRNA (N6-isopentenyl adenosine(37)-C2)-methylthiotransferase MiaB [Candidatus Hydrogenedentota bacterium]
MTPAVPKFFIQTFGCQMNEHDSFRMSEILKHCGFEATDCPSQADVILINTCSVRRNPQNKVFSLLGQLRRLKKSRPNLIIGVAGCVAQQEGENILRCERAVDMVFGPDHYFRLPEILERVRKGERVVLTNRTDDIYERVDNFIPDNWLEAGHVEGCKAYVVIMKGCNNFCAFCVVPHTRGREVCREPQNILREIKTAVEKGAKEVWLLGQNVNSYRAHGMTFYNLLDEVSQIDGLLRVRFTSSHPKDWDNTLSDLMAERPTICNQLHLPLQSGSNRILDLMNRRHTIEEYLEKIRYLKNRLHDIELSTDIIVGFPTETEEDFEATLRVLEEVRYSQVFSFKYSPRPNTRAAEMPDDIPQKVKEERLQRLIHLQEKINGEQIQSYIGTVQSVLIDGSHLRDSRIKNGRTEGYRPVKIRDAGLKVGDLVNVRITGFENHWLEGVLQ